MMQPHFTHGQGRWALISLFAMVLTFVVACSTVPVSPALQPAGGGAAVAPRWGVVIHGGAGNIDPEALAPERQAEYRATLESALRAAHHVLAQDGTSVDAVTAAILILEDSPLFNAGKGAVFTHDGKNEMDAAIMNGRTQAAGAVAAVQRVKNPILLARSVMETSPHVLMIGEGAEALAKERGVPLVDPSYFYTEQRWKQLERAWKAEKQGRGPLSQRVPDGASEGSGAGEYKFGTVGAVALDKQGNLAAGTSTGGMTNKRTGRVGDTPIVGAGTYASPTCAVSGTGHGEFFIRYTVAHDICARAQYQGIPLEQAARAVVMDVLVKAGGEGGIIAMDGRGHATMVFNTKSMYRGTMGPDGVPTVSVFSDPAGAGSKAP